MNPRSSPALIQSFRRDGFALISDLFAPAAVKEARDQFFAFMKAQAAANGVAAEGPPVKWSWQVFNDPALRAKIYELCQDLSAAHRLTHSPQVGELCRALGIELPLLRNSTIRIDYPGDDRVLQPAHQDIRAVRTANCLNFWVPLQPVDAVSGGLKVYRGSAADGPVVPDGVNVSGYQIIKPEILARYKAETLSLVPGQALVFNPFVIHESTANRSDDVRLTWVFRFDDGAAIDWIRKGKPDFAKYDAQK